MATWDGCTVLYYAEEQIVRPSSHTTDVVDGTLQVRCDQAFNIQDPRQQDIDEPDGRDKREGGGRVLASDGIGKGWVLLLGGCALCPVGRLAWPLALEGTRLQRAAFCAPNPTNDIIHQSPVHTSMVHCPPHTSTSSSTCRPFVSCILLPRHQHCQLPLHFPLPHLDQQRATNRVGDFDLPRHDSAAGLSRSGWSTATATAWIVGCDTHDPRDHRGQNSRKTPVACRPDHHDPLDAAAPPLSSQLRHRPGMRPRPRPRPPTCPHLSLAFTLPARPHACTLQWTSHQAPQMARPTPQPAPRPSSPRSPANPLPAQQP